jgi:hypothetical protein
MVQTASTTQKKPYSYLPSAIFIGILIILSATNPNEQRFKEFLKEDFKKQANKEGVGILGKPIGWIAGLTTKRKNYVLFSSFEVDILGDKYTYIGILNHFIKTAP